MVARLDGEFRALLGQPAIARRIADLGGEVGAKGPEAFRRWLDREVEAWGEVIRANAIKLD